MLKHAHVFLYTNIIFFYLKALKFNGVFLNRRKVAKVTIKTAKTRCGRQT